jgi:heavy metal sensor kinase
LILLFAGIVLLSFRVVLIRNLDRILYNSGKILADMLPEYTLQDDNDPSSLYEANDYDQDRLIDNIDEEIDNVFFVDNLYVQLILFPEGATTPPQVLIKTSTLHESVLPFSQKTYQSLQSGSSPFETVHGIFDFPLRMLSMKAEDMDGRSYVFQMALPLQEVANTLWVLFLIFVTVFPLLFVVLTVVGYGFMKRAFAPVRKMVAVTKQITAEDLSLRLEHIESQDEIGELADTLNSMIARLEQSFQQIRQFSGDVSHELKTPLAELKCNAEVALRKQRTQEDYEHTLQNIIEDVEHLQKIVEDLLLLSRIDSNSQAFVFRRLALQEVFLEVFERLHPLARQKALTLEFQNMDSVEINGDPGLLQQVFTNLITNAIRYTPSGGKISFMLQQRGNRAVVTVADTGIGIPEEHLPHIFDRFYRVEQSRSHETGGSGLGLAIAQQIIQAHGGAIEVRSVVNRGTTVQVSLPSVVAS